MLKSPGSVILGFLNLGIAVVPRHCEHAVLFGLISSTSEKSLFMCPPYIGCLCLFIHTQVDNEMCESQQVLKAHTRPRAHTQSTKWGFSQPKSNVNTHTQTLSDKLITVTDINQLENSLLSFCIHHCSSCCFLLCLLFFFFHGFNQHFLGPFLLPLHSISVSCHLLPLHHLVLPSSFDVHFISIFNTLFFT